MGFLGFRVYKLPDFSTLLVATHEPSSVTPGKGADSPEAIAPGEP